MLNKKTLLLILILIIGTILRILATYHQPLWLDEQYSIMFATQFSIKELLVKFSQDTHPGLYYALLKNLLKITNNKTILRFVSSILPQLIAMFFLILHYFKKKQTRLLLLIFFLSLNPFFIHLSTQLRGYSLVFLSTILTLIFLEKWQNKKQTKYILITLFSLIIGNSTHYIMYVFSFFVIFYILSELKLVIHKQFIIFILGIILLSGQFIISNGFSSPQQYKSQFLDAAWIPQPSLSNIPSVYLTILGFHTNVMNTSKNNIIISIIFYTATIAIVWIFFQNKFHQKSNKTLSIEKKQIIYLSLMPIAIILLGSWILPFLSKRFFIHQFIPKLSLFLPRVHLPFIINFGITMAAIISNSKINKKYIYLIITITIVWWTTINYQLNFKSQLSSIKKQQELQQIIKINNKNIYIWPHWMTLESIQLNKLNNIQNISKIQNKSKKLEYILQYKNISSINCESINKKTIYTYNNIIPTQIKLQNEILNYLSTCCNKKTKKTFQFFDKWECN